MYFLPLSLKCGNILFKCCFLSADSLFIVDSLLRDQHRPWLCLETLYKHSHTHNGVGLPDRADVHSDQFKFTLLDVSRCLHISESTVGISHTFRYQRSGELGKGSGKRQQMVLATNFQKLKGRKVNYYVQIFISGRQYAQLLHSFSWGTPEDGWIQPKYVVKWYCKTHKICCM
jgi:hypothetical protein